MLGADQGLELLGDIVMLQRSRLTSVVRSLAGIDVSSAGAWWAGAEKDEPDDGSGPRPIGA